MSKKDLSAEKTDTAIEAKSENSAFACDLCNKMYVYEDALAISMTCCGKPLKELLYEASIP
jgi:transcription initiation factor IIE alpha subunit